MGGIILKLGCLLEAIEPTCIGNVGTIPLCFYTANLRQYQLLPRTVFAPDLRLAIRENTATESISLQPIAPGIQAAYDRFTNQNTVRNAFSKVSLRA